MKLPIGMLAYWTNRFEEDLAIISGMWYYKEIFVPSTIDEKKNSIKDLKEKHCTVLQIHGTFDQILDILMQSDKFIEAGESEIAQFIQLKDEISNSPTNNAYIFDDIYHIKGTSLMLDTFVEVDETMDDVLLQIKKGQTVHVSISENWSFAGDLLKMI